MTTEKSLHDLIKGLPPALQADWARGQALADEIDQAIAKYMADGVTNPATICMALGQNLSKLLKGMPKEMALKMLDGFSATARKLRESHE